jgi:FAD/FMN-containing dehydrogenase
MKTPLSFFSSIPPFYQELAKNIQGDVNCSQENLNAHSTDGGIICIRPQIVLYPKTTNDIKQALIFAHEFAIPLTVCGGLSAATGGGLTEGIQVDLRKYFNKVRQVNMVEQTVTVDAGVLCKDFLAKLTEWNLDLPILKRDDVYSTIGGEVATKSCSPATFRHGTIREWVESVTVILDSGEEHTIKDGVIPSGRLLSIYQAVFPFINIHAPEIRADRPENGENASGYNLWSTAIGPRQLLDQIIGSEGTLAIITQVTFRLSQRNHERTTIAINLENITLVARTIQTLTTLGCESLFFYDQHYAELAGKISKSLLLGETQKKYHILASFPIEKNLLFKTKINNQLDTLGVTLTISDERTLLHMPAEQFMRHAVETYSKKMLTLTPLAPGLICSREDYTSFICDIESYMNSQGVLYFISGCAGSAHVGVYGIFDTKARTYASDILRHMSALYSIAKNYKGGISAHSGDGITKTPYLPLIYNKTTLELFSILKKIWDPNQLFNSLKKTGATTKNIEHYLQ